MRSGIRSIRTDRQFAFYHQHPDQPLISAGTTPLHSFSLKSVSAVCIIKQMVCCVKKCYCVKVKECPCVSQPKAQTGQLKAWCISTSPSSCLYSALVLRERGFVCSPLHLWFFMTTVWQLKLYYNIHDITHSHKPYFYELTIVGISSMRLLVSLKKLWKHSGSVCPTSDHVNRWFSAGCVFVFSVLYLKWETYKRVI